MFVNNINPTLFSVFGFEIRFYGLVYFFVFLGLYYFLDYHRKKLNCSRKQVDDFIMSLFLGMLIFARIFHFMFSDFWSLFSLELFKIWHGGMSFFGALFGMFVFGFGYLKYQKLNWKRFADYTALFGALGLAFGRIANYINSELVGKVSSLPWCVVFSKVDQYCRHPYQIYMALGHFLMFFVLIYLYFKKVKAGVMFYWFLILYGLTRFFLDFFRVEGLQVLGLSVWQWMSLVIILVGFNNLYKSKCSN